MVELEGDPVACHLEVWDHHWAPFKLPVKPKGLLLVARPEKPVFPIGVVLVPTSLLYGPVID